MQRRYSPDHVGKMFGVTKQTVIGWCKDGTMPAVNVARASATRERWRMSDDDIATFEERRQNKTKPTAAESKSSRRTVQRPTHDFFAKPAEGGKGAARSISTATSSKKHATLIAKVSASQLQSDASPLANLLGLPQRRLTSGQDPDCEPMDLLRADFLVDENEGES